MQEMKTMLLEEVRMKVYGRLKEVVGEIVKGVVAREVQRRVRKEVSGVFVLFCFCVCGATSGKPFNLTLFGSSCMNRSRRR